MGPQYRKVVAILQSCARPGGGQPAGLRRLMMFMGSVTWLGALKRAQLRLQQPLVQIGSFTAPRQATTTTTSGTHLSLLNC